MLIPAEHDLAGVRGASWDVQFQLWADEAETKPFDLSVYETIVLEVEYAGTAELGAGLTIVDPAQGLIEAVLSPEQTSQVMPTTAYRLRCVKSDGSVDFPVCGAVTWTTP